MHSIPDIFAILRTQSTRGPIWQILSATTSETISKITSDETIVSVTQLFEEYRPFGIHEAKIRLPYGTLTRMKFWYLPILLNAFGKEIPVLDFEYKSWLPVPIHRVAVESLDEVKNRYKEGYNRYQNYSESYLTISDFSSLPNRPPTPPRPSRTSSPDSIESVATVLEFLPDSSKPLHLPAVVGKLLAIQAWENDECCPIIAIPYRELDSLSVTSCFHVFDTESLSVWRQTKNECPVCRCQITNVVNQKKN